MFFFELMTSDRKLRVQRGLEMKNVRDLKNLTIHDVHHMSDEYSEEEIQWKGVVDLYLKHGSSQGQNLACTVSSLNWPVHVG